MGRASYHFDALKRAMDQFVESESDSPIFDFESDDAQGVIKLRIVRPIPPDWGLVIGDCIFNFRAALDHLICEVVLANGGTDITKTEFPIFLDPLVYGETSRKTGAPSRRSGLFKIAGVPSLAETIIEGLQPYNRRAGPQDRHPLWLLHEISNEDKHRSIHIALASLQDGAVSASGNIDGITYIRALSGYIEDGAVIATYPPWGERPPEFKMKVKFEFATDIAFDPKGPGRGLPVFDTLIEMAEFITAEVLPPLEALL